MVVLAEDSSQALKNFLGLQRESDRLGSRWRMSVAGCSFALFGHENETISTSSTRTDMSDRF
jgi:hypothetical protein